MNELFESFCNSKIHCDGCVLNDLFSEDDCKNAFNVIGNYVSSIQNNKNDEMKNDLKEIKNILIKNFGGN